jgi:hypothetical protein
MKIRRTKSEASALGPPGRSPNRVMESDSVFPMLYFGILLSPGTPIDMEAPFLRAIQLSA